MFSIGRHQITTPLLLAPMAGVSDRPFREVCSVQGAGLTVGEMVAADPALWYTEKNRLRRMMPRVSGPQMVQIAGSDPDHMAAAAKAHVELGADIIDINMGCPAKKVLQKAAGSALLRDVPRVQAILRAVVAAVDVPVTLKIRTGWCPQSRNGVEIAKLAEQAGISMLTVHGRTRACRFLGQAEYDTIAEIKRSVRIPVIANGDIDTPQKARFVIEHTGADGIMVGRGAHGRPWVFRQFIHYLQHGRQLPSLPAAEIQAIITAHVQGLHEHYGDFKGVLHARKHVNAYVHQLSAEGLISPSSAAQFWQSFSQCTEAWQQSAALHSLFLFITDSTRDLAA